MSNLSLCNENILKQVMAAILFSEFVKKKQSVAGLLRRGFFPLYKGLNENPCNI
jgi:hypothetical protein